MTQAVDNAWAGLGYYRRGRLLQKGAQEVVHTHGGSLPSTAEQLKKIPGIGDYTAGAIASIAFGQATPAVDGNVVRVLARLRAVALDARNPSLLRRVWRWGHQLVPAPSSSSSAVVDVEDTAGGQRPGDFNQALMELGATVCTPTRPACHRCPLADVCVARSICSGSVALSGSIDVSSLRAAAEATWKSLGMNQDGPVWEPDYFPSKPKKAAPRKEDVRAAVCLRPAKRDSEDSTPCWEDAWEVLLVQRPEEGLLAGQWGPPFRVERTANAKGAKQKHKQVDASEEENRQRWRELFTESLGVVSHAVWDDATVVDAEQLESESVPESMEGAVAVARSCDAVPSSRRDDGLRWCGSDTQHVFSGVVQSIQVEGVARFSRTATEGESQRWVSVSALPAQGLSTWACKVLVSGLGPLVCRASEFQSAPGTFRGVAHLVHRAKLETRWKQRYGWQPPTKKRPRVADQIAEKASGQKKRRSE